jgi:ABC-type transporter Mla subunit MlaD
MNPSPSQLRLTGIFLACGTVLGLVALGSLLGGRLMASTLSLACEVRGQSVSGLSKGAKVQLRGIEVGRITSLEFDAQDPERILIGIEVERSAPVYQDAVATLEIFGITGLKYLELVPGNPATGLARPGSILPTRPSQTTAILNSLDTVARTSAHVLVNLERMTGQDRQKQIDSIVTDLRGTSRSLAAFSASLQGMHLDRRVTKVANHMENVARKVDSTIAVIQPARTMARIDTATAAISNVARRADLMLGRSQSGIYHTIEDMSTTMRNLADFSQTIRDNPTVLLRSMEKKER